MEQDSKRAATRLPEARLSERAREAIRLLRLWREGDEQEQRDTWEYLRRVLDEDRPSYRKLFP